MAKAKNYTGGQQASDYAINYGRLVRCGNGIAQDQFATGPNTESRDPKTAHLNYSPDLTDLSNPPRFRN